MPEEIILEAKNLHKTYRYPVKISLLRGLNLSVIKGSTVAIIGRSGQGKSTLLQILGTLESPCSGVLKIAGETIYSLNKSRIRNKRIGFVFQSFHLLDDYTALENVLMPARIDRQKVNKGSAAYKRGMELLDHVGLTDRAHFHTKLLSGGEKQRTALARSLCNNPDLIFADEPSGNLDNESAFQIHQLLLDLSRKQGKTVVVVTHDVDFAQLCDKTYMLNNGVLFNKHAGIEQTSG